jgi:hypothetical protein
MTSCSNKNTKNKSLCGFNNISFFSSFFFISNIILSYILHNTIYLILFFGLFITSTITHFTQNFFFVKLDMCFISFIIVYGFVVFIKKINHVTTFNAFLFALSIIFCFYSCIYIYLKYSQKKINILNHDGYYFHILVHLFGSLGHNLILLM